MRIPLSRLAARKKTLALTAGLAMLAGTTVAIPLATAQSEAGDLTTGAVFVMSNASDADGGNVVVAYHRNSDGSLSEAGRFPTGGAGSGSFEDTANGLVLGTSQGEAAPNNIIELADGGQQLLFATNAGSNSISVFQVNPDGLDLVDVEHSNGEKPVSVTVNNGVVYVLNSGETFDDLFDADGNIVQNCTTGDKPMITGFTVTDDGEMSAMNGSTRRLTNEQTSGCAQVSFSPNGAVLVVTERTSQPRRLGQQRNENERLDDEGVINTFDILGNGRPGNARRLDATGQGPFGFTFTKSGNLVIAEQFDGPGGVGRGGAASYQVADNGELLRSSPSVQNGGTDTCWMIANDDETIAFATSFFGDGRISSYELDEVGLVRLIEDVATGDDALNDDVAVGASDISLSSDSDYLYQLNSLNGTISVFANNGDGTLDFVEMQTPFPQEAFGPGGGMGAPLGISAN